jgi:hypothetical protein
MSNLAAQNYITLSQQINHAFLSPKGYDGYRNMQSHGGHGMYDSYIRQNKCFASGITQLNFQVSFVSKFNGTI